MKGRPRWNELARGWHEACLRQRESAGLGRPGGVVLVTAPGVQSWMDLLSAGLVAAPCSTRAGGASCKRGVAHGALCPRRQGDNIRETQWPDACAGARGGLAGGYGAVAGPRATTTKKDQWRRRHHRFDACRCGSQLTRVLGQRVVRSMAGNKRIARDEASRCTCRFVMQEARSRSSASSSCSRLVVLGLPGPIASVGRSVPCSVPTASSDFRTSQL